MPIVESVLCRLREGQGQFIMQVENQQLKVAQVSEEFRADHGSEIKLQWCWQRRGLAMDQCRTVVMGGA